MTGRHSLTILFADVSGSTKLFETRGDEAAVHIIGTLLIALAEVATRHGGRVVKTIGDEIMCTFPAPLSGLLAATEMQRRVKSDPAFVRDNLALRIGLHHGEALVDSDDVFGDAVNTAARMADKTLARRDQIVTTASTVNGVASTAGLSVRPLGTTHVLGKAKPLEIVDVLWQEDHTFLTTVQRVVQLSPLTARSALALRFKDQEFEIDEVSPPFTIGRDQGNTLVIQTEWVSRNHAMVEWKRGHFMLTDRSTNGTWVRIADDDEILVHHDEVRLRRGGTISIGQAHQQESSNLVAFRCLDRSGG